MSKSITFTGGPNSTLVLHARHKKSKSILRVYPAKSLLETGDIADYRHYHKKEAIATLKFKSRDAIEQFIMMLNVMRDKMLLQDHGAFRPQKKSRVQIRQLDPNNLPDDLPDGFKGLIGALMDRHRKKAQSPKPESEANSKN